MLKYFNEIKNHCFKIILMKLAIHNVNVQYLPGKKICIADFLFRDYINNYSIEKKFINDYIHIINTKKVK